jgi:hypothetical protein
LVVFERFTDRARRVLVLAQEEARLLNHGFIGTEHILLGLLGERDGVAARALATLEISPEGVLAMVTEIVGSAATEPMGSPPFTPRAKRVLELALREALQLGHNYIGTEHMLLGVVREGEGVAAQVLVHFVDDLGRVRHAVMQLLVGRAGPEGTAPVGQGGARTRGSTARLSGVTRARIVRCSFCGRRPPDAGQLVSGADAFICEHCIRHWAVALPAGGDSSEPIEAHHVLSSSEVLGPPPDDEGAARVEITAAYAACGTASEDGRSVPSVERGDDLGPTLQRAQGRGPAQMATRAAIEVTDIAFVDRAHAAVWFTITIDGNPALSSRRGEAVAVDGAWKMARATFCELMRLAGIECPPEPRP